MADPGVAKDRELASWRRRLLPLMSGVLMALTGVFVIASFWQIHDIQQRIDAPDRSSADSVFRTLEQQMGSGRVAVPAGYADVRMIAALETDALTRRYRHASAALLARTLTRYMGFLTGMIMANGSIDLVRARSTGEPRLIIAPESRPPVMEPRSAVR